MKNIIPYIILLFTMSCEEDYHQEGLDTGKNVFVVEGLLTDASPVCKIKISYASPYGSTLRDAYANGIIFYVTIIDDSLKRTYLDYKDGVYQNLTDSISAKPGHSYKLQIYSRELGALYETPFIKMPDKPIVDTIYPKKGIENVISKNSLDEIVVKKQAGLSFHIGIHNNSNTKHYEKINTTVLNEIIHVPPHGDYWTVKKLSDVPVIAASYNYNGLERVNGFKMGFYPYQIGPELLDSNYYAISIGWILLTEVYSISPNEYKFYRIVNQQLNPTYTIFDPISTQIPSNIRLTSDTTQYMLGYFEVASVARENTYFYVTPNLRYYKINLPDTFTYYPMRFSDGDAWPSFFIWNSNYVLTDSE